MFVDQHGFTVEGSTSFCARRMVIAVVMSPPFPCAAPAEVLPLPTRRETKIVYTTDYEYPQKIRQEPPGEDNGEPNVKERRRRDALER